MKKDKVILSQKFHPEIIRHLAEEFELIIAESDLITAVKKNPDARALISFLSDPVDAKIIDQLSGLKVIANFAVGYNNIDFNHAIKKGIYVCHTPDVLTSATAEIAITLMLTVCRRIIPAHNFTINGNFKGWKADLFLGKDLANAVMGIVGMGRIGLATALRAQPFVKQIIYYSRHRKPDVEKKYGFVYRTFIDLLRQADVISLHLPYSADLHHLFNKDSFALMKENAVFINVARGKLVDENALADFLESKRLFGAGLDVYENEPQINPRLLQLDNVVLLPHIGSAVDTVRLQMALMCWQSVRAALNNQTPPFLIPEARSIF